MWATSPGASISTCTGSGRTATNADSAGYAEAEEAAASAYRSLFWTHIGGWRAAECHTE
jgi:hypothetical protein